MNEDTKSQVALSGSENNLFEQLKYEFGQSMFAIQAQNVAIAESSYLKASNIVKTIWSSLDSNEKILANLILNQINIVIDFLNSMFLMTEQRYLRALELQNNIVRKCNESESMILEIVSSEVTEDELIHIFKASALAFGCLARGSSLELQMQIDKSNGKFVDEISICRKSIEEYKKIDQWTWPKSNNEIYYIFSSIIKNATHFVERKIERLLEERKKISFIYPTQNKVFIVHGHDHAILLELKEILSVSFKIKPIILSDMPDKGGTVIEKFEHYAKDTAFAFVIFTPDDIVKNKEKHNYQGRPNVIFELGWFCGRFGRERVRILKQKNTVLPSDLNGIVTIEFQNKLEEVFRKINADLENNGLIEKI